MNKRMKKGIAIVAAAAALLVGSTLTVWAATRLETVSSPWWNDEHITIAEWDEVEDAYQYEVYLYCNESKVADIKTKRAKFDFEKKMTKEGDYTFRVRALAKSSSREYRDSYWSEYSDGTYIVASYAELIKNGGKIDTTNSGPGATGQENTATPATGVVTGGKWIQNQTGWWYQRTDGTFPVNQWFQDSATSKWYYFNPTGYMLSGWIELNGVHYYCGTDGAMLTGEVTIDSALYQFDTSGALIGNR